MYKNSKRSVWADVVTGVGQVELAKKQEGDNLDGWKGEKGTLSDKIA